MEDKPDKRRPELLSARPTEKLGHLGDPGFYATRFPIQGANMVFVTYSAQSPQDVSERWFLLPAIPRSVRELEEGMATQVEPDDGKTVQEEGDRCGSLDGEW